jgi:uncharacterized membrane protein YgcG
VHKRVTAALVAVLALLACATALGLAAALSLATAPAWAQAPFRVSSEITDHSGVLGDRRGDVQAAITSLYDKDRIKLYVVYVPSFSGLTPTTWVDDTAARSGMGTRDVLLGVATSDRNYAVSADPNLGLSTTRLDAVNSIAIEPALRKSDWATAAIGAADGIAAAVAGHPIPAPALNAGVAPRHPAPAASAPGHTVPAHAVPSHPLPTHPAHVYPAPARPAGSSNTGEFAALAAAAAVLIGVALLAARRMSRGGYGGGRPQAAGPPPGPTTDELEAQAARALVDTDDAIKTSDQELGFAVATFGESAAAPFSVALKSARAELAAAFKVRQQLDDEIPEPEPVKRQMLAEISGRCAEANRLLDEQSEAFDRLQDLEARAPEVLAEVTSHATQQAARLEPSRQTLSKLAARYTPGAVAVVASSPEQAAERLEFTHGRLTDARTALAADTSGEAAVFLQAAESAADQAESLLDGIEHLEAELTQASSALPAALREIDVEIAEATALLAGKPDERAGVISRAQAAAAAVRDQVAAGAPFDALAALRDLEQADAALDHTLASARAERDRQDRARAVLDQAMLVARSSITAAEDFITTRRGGVGATARTRLAEAQRHFQQAIALATDDPESAVNEAQHADALAQDARSLAEQDVDDYHYGQQGTVIHTGGFGAGFGGGFGGAVLGGILIDSLFGGRGGGFGGGLGPGSFGGIGTRGRHSIGGMF